MCGFYSQLFEGIDELLRDDVRNFAIRKIKMFKMKKRIEKAAEELYDDFLKKGENKDYYEALYKYVENNKVIYTVIKECKTPEMLRQSSVENLATEYAEKFAQNYDERYTRYENDIKELLLKLFYDAFDKINEIEDIELQKAVNKIRDVLHSSFEHMKEGINEVKGEVNKVYKKLDEVIEAQNSSSGESEETTSGMTLEEIKEGIKKAFEHQKA